MTVTLTHTPHLPVLFQTPLEKQGKKIFLWHVWVSFPFVKETLKLGGDVGEGM